MSILLAFSLSAAANTVVDAATDFVVPTISAAQFSIQGQDFLSTTGVTGSDGELSTFNFHLGSTISVLNQSPMMTVSVVNQIDLRSALEDEQIPVTMEENLQVNILKYLSDSRGAFTYGGAEFDAEGGASVDTDPYSSGDLHLAAGAGYGRIVDARTVAQAAAAYKVVQRRPTAKKLAEVAEVIGQRSQYFLKHRFEADKFFYADLAAAMGGLNSTQLFDVRQVLDSPIYNIGSRRVGWTAGAGVETSMTGIGGDETRMEDLPLYQFSGYATLLNSRTGVYISQEMRIRNAVTEADSSTEFNITAALNTDHTPSWQSIVETGVNGERIDGSDSASWFLKGQSNLAIGSMLVASTGLNLDRSMLESNSPMNWELISSFTYFLY